MKNKSLKKLLKECSPCQRCIGDDKPCEDWKECITFERYACLREAVCKLDRRNVFIEKAFDISCKIHSVQSAGVYTKEQCEKRLKTATRESLKEKKHVH